MGDKSQNTGSGDNLLTRLDPRKAVGAVLFWGFVWGITGFDDFLFWIFGFCALASAGVLNWLSDGDTDPWTGEKKSAKRRGSETEIPGAQPVEATPAPLAGAPVAPPPPLAIHQRLIAEAAPAQAKLEAAAGLALGELGTRLRAMVASVKAVNAGLEADPAKLAEVQRLYTFYLPSTADLLARLAANPDEARAAEIHAMLVRLEPAFADFEERVRGHDARSLAIDLKMLDQSLEAEFGPVGGKTR